MSETPSAENVAPLPAPLVARMAMERVLVEVKGERLRQEAKWGQQNHADGTGRECDKATADAQREACDRAFREGWGTWSHILREEVAEAMAESDPALLRDELIQVAAVASAWVEAIDRRDISVLPPVEGRA